jgi:ABC-type uncharacterized transport system fused permease/ATPase subunit
MALPNYQHISSAFATLHHECSLIQNIPAITNNAALVELLHELRNEVREVRNEVRESRNETRERFLRLETGMNAQFNAR